MSSDDHQRRCEKAEQVCDYALRALPETEMHATETHLASCPLCTKELDALRPAVDALLAWPTDLMHPSAQLQARLARRIATENGGALVPPPSRRWAEPRWKEVAPGICCKLLATDSKMQRISMLVRLDPGAHYPPHTHAGVEELHLLDGELWIDDRKLYPGDYKRAQRGTGDKRVWSETGCTCVLITSTEDALS